MPTVATVAAGSTPADTTARAAQTSRVTRHPAGVTAGPPADITALHSTARRARAAIKEARKTLHRASKEPVKVESPQDREEAIKQAGLSDEEQKALLTSDAVLKKQHARELHDKLTTPPPRKAIREGSIVGHHAAKAFNDGIRDTRIPVKHLTEAEKERQRNKGPVRKPGSQMAA